MTAPADTAAPPAPGDFDARWYARRYPDVALSGLDPEAHYRRIGRMLGRAGAPLQGEAAGQGSADGAADAAMDELLGVAARFGTRSRRDDPPDPPAREDDPLIARPRGLRLGAAAAATIGPAQIDDPVDAFHLATPADIGRVAAPLEILRALRDGRHRGLAELSALAVGEALREGPDAISDLWVEGAARMCLKLGGEISQRAQRADGGFVSAWQAAPKEPKRLRRVGHAALPVSGPLWWELELDNPFMPVLVCLADAAQFTRDAAVIAFPSLARGGSHAAELALHRENGAGIGAFWRLSECFLQALETQVPAIGGIEIILATATGAVNGSEPIFDPDIGDWLEHLFGLRPGISPLPVDSGSSDELFAADEGRAWLAEAYPPRRRNGARLLHLPADHIPSFAALLAAEADLPAVPDVVGPFLVADALTGRPRWSVSLPQREMPWLPALQPLPRAAACPVLRGGPDRAQVGRHAADGLTAMPLGIARRHTALLSQAQSLMRLAPDAPGLILPRAPVQEGPFSVVLRLRDARRAVQLVEAVATAASRRDFQVLAVTEDRTEAARFFTAAAARLGAEVRILPAGADLARAAALARHDEILTLDDRVVLSDGRALAALRSMLASSSDIGSAACTLLRETISGNAAELAASGGMFPARISLLSAPALVIEEPDTGETLPLATYPVIGAALDFALLRRDAILSAAEQIAAVGPDQADTAFALAASGAGYVHLVTSAVAVGTTAPPRAKRSEMDPVGLGALRARKWDRLLASVTILKELR